MITLNFSVSSQAHHFLSVDSSLSLSDQVTEASLKAFFLLVHTSYNLRSACFPQGGEVKSTLSKPSATKHASLWVLLEGHQ